MKRLLSALLLCAAPAFAQANGWQEVPNLWGEIQTPPGYSTMLPPTGCSTTELAYFLGSPAVLTCLDQVYWTAATRSLDVTDGRVQAANLKAISLATPGSITVAPTLTQTGTITTVAGADLVDGDYFTIDYGTGVIPIEFDELPGDGTSGGRIPYVFDPLLDADAIRDGLITLIGAAAPTAVTATSGGAATIALTRIPAGTAGGTITENVTNAGFLVTGFADPTAATTYTYKLVARLADGTTTEAGAASSTAAGHATLSAANYNALSWSAVTGAASYDVYKTVGGTTGLIASATTALSLNDTGLAGGGETAPTVDGTGRVTADGLTIATGASSGYVWTSDANGVGSWAAASGVSGLTAGRVALSTGPTSVGDDAGLLFDATNNRLSLVGGLPATDGTAPALSVTATLPASPSATVSGVNVNVTSAGNAGKAQTGMGLSLAAGYTGSSPARALSISNLAESSGSSTFARAGNIGALVTAGDTSSTANSRTGVYAVAEGDATANKTATGVIGIANLGSASGTRAAGVIGASFPVASGFRAGGFFQLAVNEANAQLLGATAALVADNTDQAQPIALFRDNGTTKVSIEDGGALCGNSTKTLTESSATGFVEIAVASGAVASATIDYEIEANDSTDFQTLTGSLYVSAVNKAGTVTCNVGEVGTPINAVSTGTLTNTMTCTAGTLKYTINANAVSSLTQTTLRIKYLVRSPKPVTATGL